METTEEYEIQISREDVQTMILDATNNHTGTKKQMNLVGNFMSVFEAKVYEVEKHMLPEPFKIMKKNYNC